VFIRIYKGQSEVCGRIVAQCEFREERMRQTLVISWEGKLMVSCSMALLGRELEQLFTRRVSLVSGDCCGVVEVRKAAVAGNSRSLDALVRVGRLILGLQFRLSHNT
jgi:hypothetical protein